MEDPVHTYPGVDIYPACLTVNNDSGCVNTFCHYVNIGNDIEDKCEFSCVWPGDANNDLEANHYDLIALCLNWGETGPVRDSISIRWIGHHAQDWSTFQIDGVNNKHGDCDGDGTIALADIEAIKQNFGYSHPKQYKSYNAANPDLYFEILTDDIAPGSNVDIAIMADSVELYGIGFEVEFDNTMISDTTLSINYTNSWLGTEGSDMLTLEFSDFTKDNTSSISLSRKDKNNTTGSGELATISMMIDSNITSDQELVICLTTDYGMNADGDVITFNGNVCDTISITTSIKEVKTKEDIRIYPNPTKGNVYIWLPESSQDDYKVEIFNSLGQEVKRFNTGNDRRIKLNLNNFDGGIYYIKVSSDKEVYQKPLYLIK